MIGNPRLMNPPRRTTPSSGALALEPPHHSQAPVSILTLGTHLIGTDEACGVRLNAEGVQPRHAMILVGEQKTLLKAIDPRTWVNDGFVTETALRVGDRLSIGPITYKVRRATQSELDEHELQITAIQQLVESAASVAPLIPPPTPHPVEPIVLPRAIEVPPVPKSVVATAPAEQPAPAALPPNITIVKSEAALSVPVQPTIDAIKIDEQFQAIQRQLQEFHQQSEIGKPTPVTARATVEPQGLSARETELKQLKEDLTSRSQLLIERSSRLDTREAELDRRQAQLVEENDKLLKSAQATQQGLVEEVERQKTLWQEWDATYQRSSAELKSQFEAIQQQREAIRDEHRQLDQKRAEVQQLQSEMELLRREIAREKVQVTEEAGRLQLQVATFESERRQQLNEWNDQQSQIENDRRELNAAREEFLAEQRALESQRASFLAERSAENDRREREQRQQIELDRMTAETDAALRAQKRELESTQRQLELERQRIVREREEFELAKRRFEKSRESTAAELVAEDHRREEEQRALLVLKDRLAETEARLLAQQAEIASVRTSLDDERQQMAHEWAELNAARAELQALREAQPREQLEPAQLVISGADEVPQNHEERDVNERRRFELDQWQQDLEALQNQLEDTIKSMREEHRAIEAARAELNVAPQKQAVQTTARGSDIEEPPEQAAGEWMPYSDTVDRLMDIYGVGPSSASAVSTEFETSESGDGMRRMTDDSPASISFNRSFASPAPEETHQLPDGGEFERQHVAYGDESGQLMAHPSTEIDYSQRHFNDMSPVGQLNDLPPEDNFSEALEREANYITNTALADNPPEMVADTLSDINRRFGFISPELEDAASGMSLQKSFEEESAAGAGSESSSTNSENPLSDLRAKLAQMFEMSNDDQAVQKFGSHEETTIPGEHLVRLNSLDAATAESRSPQSFENGAVEQFSAEPSQTPPAPAPLSPPAEVAQSSDSEDPWERRLRELAAVAQGNQSPPPVPKAAPNPPADKSNESDSDDDEQFSVEAQLARLLGKPLNSNPPEPDLKSIQPVAIARTEEVAVADQPEPEEPVVADRSHLSSGPKHKQDKNAVREEVQSFRAVAQMSARKALEKHSWKNFKNEFYFSFTLMTVSIGATAWYAGSYLYGLEESPWKAISCILATGLCLMKILGLFSRLKGKRGKKTGQEQ